MYCRNKGAEPLAGRKVHSMKCQNQYCFKMLRLRLDWYQVLSPVSDHMTSFLTKFQWVKMKSYDQRLASYGQNQSKRSLTVPVFSLFSRCNNDVRSGIIPSQLALD